MRSRKQPSVLPTIGRMLAVDQPQIQSFRLERHHLNRRLPAGGLEVMPGVGHFGEAMRRIRKCGKAPGVLTAADADIRKYLAAGALFCAVGADVGILARGAEALATKYKQGN